MGNMASITEGALNLRHVVLLLTTMGVTLLLASGVAHARCDEPYMYAVDNYRFQDAYQITDANAELTCDNLSDLGNEPGEPNHAGSAGDDRLGSSI